MARFALARTLISERAAYKRAVANYRALAAVMQIARKLQLPPEPRGPGRVLCLAADEAATRRSPRRDAPRRAAPVRRWNNARERSSEYNALARGREGR